jgi:hypothetical protein
LHKEVAVTRTNPLAVAIALLLTPQRAIAGPVCEGYWDCLFWPFPVPLGFSAIAAAAGLVGAVAALLIGRFFRERSARTTKLARAAFKISVALVVQFAACYLYFF